MTLHALSRQTADPGVFEVVVVRDTLSEPAPEPPEGLRVRYLLVEHDCGPPVKRNVGWREAVAPLIAFTDDDCEPAPGWVEALLAAAGGDAVLQGRTEPNPRELSQMGPFARTLSVTAADGWFATCNVTYPRALLERLDGFDESYVTIGEDTDLAWRAHELGAELRFVDAALVYHAVENLGPRGRLRVAARWGPIFRVFKRHPHLRERLFMGLFWKPSHGHLSLAAIGLALSRRSRLGLLLVLPYAWGLRVRMTAERASTIHVPYYVVHDLVEMETAVRGSVAARTLVI